MTLTRETFGFVKGKGAEHAQCETCPMWLSQRNRCRLHSERDVIDGDDACNYWMPGKPGTTGKAYGYLTPALSGLVHRRVQCQRCSHWKKGCELYRTLTEKFPDLFKLDAATGPTDCCNAQEPR